MTRISSDAGASSDSKFIVREIVCMFKLTNLITWFEFRTFCRGRAHFCEPYAVAFSLYQSLIWLLHNKLM